MQAPTLESDLSDGGALDTPLEGKLRGDGALETPLESALSCGALDTSLECELSSGVTSARRPVPIGCVHVYYQV